MATEEGDAAPLWQGGLRWFEGNVTPMLPEYLAATPTTTLLLMLLAAFVGVALTLLYKTTRRARASEQSEGAAGTRFRKRDRIEFSARKTIRNAKALGSYIKGGHGRKRRDVAKLVKKVFRAADKEGKEAAALQARPLQLPAKFLEEEEMGSDISEELVIVSSYSATRELEKMSPELVLLTKNLRIFGDVHKSVFQDLFRKFELKTVRTGDFLFRIGDLDEHMYIVESGELRLTYLYKSEYTHAEDVELKRVRKEDPIISLLSFLDYLAGRKKEYKTVSCRAVRDSKVIKIPFKEFKEALAKHPDDVVEVVKKVLMRLQRVTLLALNQYLGLGPELVNQANRGARQEQREQPEMEQSEVERQKNSGMEDFKDERQIKAKNDEELRSFSADIFKYYLGLDGVDHLTMHGAHDAEDMEIEAGADAHTDQEKHRLSIAANQLDLKVQIELLSMDEGQALVQEDSEQGDRLSLVLYGAVEVSQMVDDVPKAIHIAAAGGLLGQMQVVSEEASLFTYTTKAPTLIATLDGKFIRRELMEKFPSVAIHLATSVLKNLSPYVRSIDFALEHVMIESGKALYKQGKPADSIFVVLSGRLRSVITDEDGKRKFIAEYARGDLTGLLETVTQQNRQDTVIAVRDSDLAKIPAGLLSLMNRRFASVNRRIMLLVSQNLRGPTKEGDVRSQTVAGLGALTGQQGGQNMTNFSTVAIISNSPNLPVGAFSFELVHALNQLDPSIRLTRDYVLEQLGPGAFDKANNIKLTSWLAYQEDKNRVVLYVCEPYSADGHPANDRERKLWTNQCLRHADVIFILVDPTGPSVVTKMEEDLEKESARTRKELIFLHKEDVKYPKGTAKWLQARPWCNGHYHVRCPPRMFFKKKRQTLDRMYHQKVLCGPPPDIHSDFSRLARVVTASTVGLVLGGGGARGCSHVGLIKSILESGIPIDHVGGVSIGALIGGIWCQEKDVVGMTVLARSAAAELSTVSKQLWDLTFPTVSWLKGARFNRIIEDVFDDRDIRDLWIPYFTITTDITDSSMRVHDMGSLWRYVRASMSLAGYLPPLCDPKDGHLLLDGGYVNNLPADIMKSVYGAKRTLAIDVGAQDDVKFDNYGDTLSGWKVMILKYSPFHTPMAVPGQADIQSRLAYVSCVGKLEVVKNADYCEYIRPPIDRFQTLQFKLFDEIREVGYNHGQTYFAGIKRANVLKNLTRQHSTDRYWHPHRRSSFENLSALSSSLESQAGAFLFSSSAPSPALPSQFVTHSPATFTPPPVATSSLSNLAARESPARGGRRLQVGSEEARRVSGNVGDDELTDEDSENLITDEEDDDGESGFLSQI